MIKHNANNERIKRQYFIFLKEAKRQDEASVDAAAKSISRFESYTKFKDFKAFHFEQAVGFKKHLANQDNQQTGNKLSKATLNSTLRQLKAFFEWLAMQSGYKSRLNYTDMEYFNLSAKDARVATAKRQKPVPTLEQVKHVIGSMPCSTEIEQRNRALIAFTLLTGARDAAIASMKIKHIDLLAKCVFQDARDVNTKFSKTFTTYFFPVGDDIEKVVIDWITHLKEELLYGNDDPLFPQTEVTLGKNRTFEASGLKREHWSTASPIRSIFRKAFEAAGLPYFNPHSFRNTLVTFSQTICQSPEEVKAWSQNLGHEGVMTTFYSYGEVQESRQGEIILQLNQPRSIVNRDVSELAKALAYEMANQG